MSCEKRLLSILLLFTVLLGVSFGQSTDDCGVKYGCFLTPTGCHNTSCTFIVKWIRTRPNSIHFILGTKADYHWYMAIGFSRDQIMGNDSVAMCKLDKSFNTSIVETYYNNYHSPPDIVNSTQRSLGLSGLSVSYSDGRLICSFTRQIKNDSFGEKFFDLNDMYYLLVAKSVLNDGNFEPYYHWDNKTYSDKLIDFRKISNQTADSEIFIKLHGSIMMFTWMVLSSIGILLARYFKTLYPNQKTCGVEFWFAFHRPLMICCPLLTIVGFFMIFYHKNWTWIDPGFTKNFIHSVFGVLTLSMAIIQPIIASFRPTKNGKNRPLFNWVHRLFGIGTFISSHVAVFLGVYMYVDSMAGWNVVAFWIFWLFFLVFVVEVNTRCSGDKEEYYSFDTAQYQLNNMKCTKKTKINATMFIIHIIIAIFVFSALLSFLIADF